MAKTVFIEEHVTNLKLYRIQSQHIR